MLNLHLVYYDDGAVVNPKWGTQTPIDQNIISDLVRNLASLDSLGVKISNQGETLRGRRFHIASPTLTYLTTLDLQMGIAVSLDCPNLRFLLSNGSPEGASTLLPFFRREGFRNQMPRVAAAPDPFRRNYTVMRIPANHPTLRVSNQCRFYLRGYKEWRFKDYDEYYRSQQQLANATYQTFEREEDAHKTITA